MDLGIAGRKAIVCASSRGLGRACAKALAEAGCEVVINGLDRERLAATAAELQKATGAKITPVTADVASPTARKRYSPHVRNRTFWSTTTPARPFATSASSTGRKCSTASLPT